MTNEEIARICHEVNKTFCECLGDTSQPAWNDAPQWQRDSAVNGVAFALSSHDPKPEDSHISWSNEKIASGWTYGPVKDADKKTHPCLVPYSDLPKEQRVKDALFLAVALGLGK